MSRIVSKIKALNDLRFEPITAAVVKVLKMTLIDQTVVALGENGVIYTNGVQAHLCYPASHEGRLARVVDGCVKMKILSADAVNEHKARAKAKADALQEKYLAERIVAQAKELGLKLTASQVKKLTAKANFNT